MSAGRDRRGVTDADAVRHRGRPATDRDPGAEAFRGRLLEGLRRSIEERGYRETTIADIVRHARASRRTFYQAFATKDDCLLALMEAANLSLIRHITDAVDPLAPWPAQARQAVAAYVHQIASSPGLSLCSIREFPSLGPVAGQVRRNAMNALADLVQRLSDNEPFRRDGGQPVSRELALIILGGLRELTATVLEEGGDVGDILQVGATATIALLGTSAPARLSSAPPVSLPAGSSPSSTRHNVPETTGAPATGRRQVLTDEQWARIQPLMPSASGAPGRPQARHRQIVEAIIYRDREKIPWRDLPAGFGPWQTAWKRHRRWSDDGTWTQVENALRTPAHAGGERPSPRGGVEA